MENRNEVITSTFLMPELTHPRNNNSKQWENEAAFQGHDFGFKTFLTGQRDDNSLYNKMTGLVDKRRAVDVYLNFMK